MVFPHDKKIILQNNHLTSSWGYHGNPVSIHPNDDSTVIVGAWIDPADPNIVSLGEKVGFADFILKVQAFGPGSVSIFCFLQSLQTNE
jgi:hypothetical protein